MISPWLCFAKSTTWRIRNPCHGYHSNPALDKSRRYCVLADCLLAGRKKGNNRYYRIPARQEFPPRPSPVDNHIPLFVCDYRSGISHQLRVAESLVTTKPDYRLRRDAAYHFGRCRDVLLSSLSWEIMD